MSFLGLDIAISALRANQYALNVTGNNIANASTQGYHRQEAIFLPGATTSGGTSTGQGIPQLGTGVTIHEVRRLQSSHIDGQIREMNQFLGSYSAQSDSLRQVESVFGEPGGSGLSTVLDQFWNAWDELASNPDNLSARIGTVEAGTALADRFRTLHASLREVQVQADQEIRNDATRINDLAHQIADINHELVRSENGVVGPNELLDRRDSLVDELSGMARIQTFGDGGGDYIVSISGKVLVQGEHVTELAASTGADGWTELSWTGDGSTFDPEGGDIEGLASVRSDLVTGYMEDLNSIAGAIVDRVNELHLTGIDMNGNPAVPFFDVGTDASNIRVNAALVATPSILATSTTGNPGDNQLATAITGVRDEILIDGQSINAAYNNLVVRMGANSREATTQNDVQQLSLQYLETQRESMAGVSIDEEMINMVKFQQAYNAAARVVSVIDEMIDTVVNRMGTGR